MKYRDPTIRSCQGVQGIKVTKPSRPPEPRVFKSPEVVQFVARPQETVGRKLQGGLPPEPFRTPWRRAGLTGKGAREPFNSKACKAEFMATADYFDGRDWDVRQAEREERMRLRRSRR